MKKIYSLTGLVLFLFVVFGCQTLKVQEAEVPVGPAGVYLAKTSAPTGDIEFTLGINADGTGYTEYSMGRSEFTGAKIEGNNFAFNTTINSEMGKMEIAFTGSVEGDDISGTISAAQVGEMPFSGYRK